MGLVEEIVQDVLAPELDVMGLERSPDYLGHYQLSNRLVNSLCHLMAVEVSQRRSRLARCDALGALGVRLCDSTGLLMSNLDSNVNLLVSLRGGTNAAEVVSSDPGPPEASKALVVADYYVHGLYMLFNDCYDTTRHSFRVTQTA